MINVITAGIISVNVYAQIFSIFYKVGLLANIIVIILSALSALVFRKDIVEAVIDIRKKISPVIIPLYLIETVLLGLITAGPSTLGDAFSYHIQGIRWINEYGVVPGVANILSRLGFNSSVYSLSALFDMSMLGEKEHLHTVTGYFILLLLFYSTAHFIDDLNDLKKKKLSLGGVINLSALVYVLIQTAWISSPVTDVPAGCILFITLIKWADLIGNDEKEETADNYILLCLLTVYATSVKVSSALYVLLAIYPAVLLIRKKEIKKTVSALIMGIVIIVPFLLRNVIITGWLLYPFKAIDLFDPDWKVSVEQVESEAYAVTDYARNPKYIDPAGKSWLYTWLKGNSYSKWILFAALFIMFAAGIIYILRTLFGSKGKNKREVFLLSVILANIMYWFVAAPDTRFGWPAIMALMTFTPFMFKGRKFIKKGLYILSFGILTIYTLFYSYRSVKLLFATPKNTFVKQVDYITSYYLLDESYRTSGEELKEKEINGHTFYIIMNPGDEYFPASQTDVINMRGASIKDGFKK
ncbi:MAG: hypothetical protein K6B28_12195 [Lachnospiraceae bacterium]|nr:hypothetical protein [Lachnospiraceae bacterium]